MTYKGKKGSGGILKMPGRLLDGMLVDFSSRNRDGVWVVLQARGPYKDGDLFHVSEWEYEELWPGTV